MKEKIKKISKVIILLLILFIPIYIAPISRADSGWDSSYGGGGGGSYGGGSYGGGSYGGGSYSSGGGGSYSGDVDPVGVIVTFIIIFVFILLITYISAKEAKPANDRNEYLRYAYADIDLEKIKKILPKADIDQLKQEAFDNFVTIQNAWMNFDYSTLREYCSDELYNTYKSQLETLKLKNGQNIMSDYDNLDTKIIGIESINGEVIMTVFMCVEFYDYVINTKTDEITRGSDQYKILNNYVMTFVMKDKSKSKKVTKCPNCGAKIKHNTSGECEYCNATIVKKASSFVLNTKKNVNQ